MKKGINGRTKGSGFERHVAGLIIDAFKEYGIQKEDCYRTPLSGGHRFAAKSDPGDLLMTPKLQALFPFVVECKFYKKLNWVDLMNPVGLKSQFGTWWAQATKAAHELSKPPLLVFKGNRTDVYCMGLSVQIKKYPVKIPILSTRTAAGLYLRVCKFDSLLKGVVYECRNGLK